MQLAEAILGKANLSEVEGGRMTFGQKIAARLRRFTKQITCKTSGHKWGPTSYRNERESGKQAKQPMTMGRVSAGQLLWAEANGGDTDDNREGGD